VVLLTRVVLVPRGAHMSVEIVTQILSTGDQTFVMREDGLTRTPLIIRLCFQQSS
jgi:hypothetical protein